MIYITGPLTSHADSGCLSLEERSVAVVMRERRYTALVDDFTEFMMMTARSGFPLMYI